MPAQVRRPVHARVVLADVFLVIGRGPFVGDGKHDLAGHFVLRHQVQDQHFGHFAGNQFRLVERIGSHEYLAAAERMGGGPVGLDIGHRTAFPAPGVVDEQFGVHPEEFVQQLFVLSPAGCAQ